MGGNEEKTRKRSQGKGWNMYGKGKSKGLEGNGREKKGIKGWNLHRKVRKREKGCKEMDENRREWMGQMERNMVKGCKEMNGREGRGFDVRDGICRGKKRDGRKQMGREERKGETKRDGKV